MAEIEEKGQALRSTRNVIGEGPSGYPVRRRLCAAVTGPRDLPRRISKRATAGEMRALDLI